MKIDKKSVMHTDAPDGRDRKENLKEWAARAEKYSNSRFCRASERKTIDLPNTVGRTKPTTTN